MSISTLNSSFTTPRRGSTIVALKSNGLTQSRWNTMQKILIYLILFINITNATKKNKLYVYLKHGSMNFQKAIDKDEDNDE